MLKYGQCIAFNPIPGVPEGWKECGQNALGSRQSLCPKHEAALYGIILGLQAAGEFFDDDDLGGLAMAYITRLMKENAIKTEAA